MKSTILIFIISVLFFARCSFTNSDPEKFKGLNYQPNILWLSTEDIGCYLPAYGDSTIQTPNLDRIAAEGIIFQNAFTVAGQCSPSRFSIISGMYPTSTAASHMRTWGRKLPDSIRYITQYLMDAGYYCTNNNKTDYAFTEPEHETLWHETSDQAHYKNRPAGQPFFAVFNYFRTHESRFFGDREKITVDPGQVPVPPYYVDNKITRKTLARNYSNIKRLDSWIGKMLSNLDSDGLLDSTIVFFWSDHGGPLPNQKREVYDRGTKVPLLVKFPNNLFAGEKVDEMVSLMDLGPTVLSLAGIKPPGYMHGQAFLGKYKAEPDSFVFAARDRIAAQYDTRRTVRSSRYRYVRNFYPELPRYQHFNYRMDIEMMVDLLQLYQTNELNEVQQIWFEKTKPVEELYDVNNDPHQVNNIINDPKYYEVARRFRQAQKKHMLVIKDVGLIPEPMIFKLQDSLRMPIYSIVRNHNYPMEKIWQVATAWTNPDNNINELANHLNDTLPITRYWAATGLGNLGEPALSFQSSIDSLLEDSYPSVRIAAAFALYQLGDTELAVASLSKELKRGNTFSRILAAFQLARIGPEARLATEALQSLLSGHSYEQQAAENALRAIKINQ